MTELREVGKTARAGYEVGVRRTLPFSAERVWAALLAPAGMHIWLGGMAEIAAGAAYTLANGTSGRIGVFALRSHLRLTWQPTGWARPSTLQLRVSAAKSETTISFHQERLRDAATRSAMKAHWERVIGQLAAMLERGDD